MAGYVDAGSLRDRLAVLELQEVRPGEWAWAPVRPAWGAVTLRDKSNLFSKVGLGARDAGIVLRRQCLTLANALGWAHGHLFLTSIVDRGGGYLDVGAAVVRPCSCTAVRTADSLGAGNRPETKEVLRISFPGVLTEKYVRYEREDTHAEQEASYVLVTGKPIRLLAGDLVTVRDGTAPGVYAVEAPHVLDEWKNEYEMRWRGDV